MNNRTSRGVELPLHQTVFWSQLQHFVGLKKMFQRWPAVILVSPEDHRQFKGRGHGWVGEDAPHGLHALLTLHVEFDGGASKPTGLISRGVQDVAAHPGGHVVRQQQHLAVEDGCLGFCQTALHLLGHILVEEPLFILQTCIKGNT